MAIFGSKKKNTEAKAEIKPVKAVVKKEATLVSPDSHASVILRPRVTEKSGILSQMNVYTFEVATHSNKDSISKAVQALYKVSPTKIAIINLPSKRVIVRGKRGTVSGIKKALVTLKKGDKIDFV